MVPVHVWKVRPESVIEAVETTEAGGNEEGLSLVLGKNTAWLRSQVGLSLGGRGRRRGRKVEVERCGRYSPLTATSKLSPVKELSASERLPHSVNKSVYSPVVVVVERAVSFGNKRLATGPRRGESTAQVGTVECELNEVQFTFEGLHSNVMVLALKRIDSTSGFWRAPLLCLQRSNAPLLLAAAPSSHQPILDAQTASCWLLFP